MQTGGIEIKKDFLNLSLNLNPFSKKSEPILQNEPIRILYPFHSPFTKNTAEKNTFSAVFFYPSRRLGISLNV